MMKMMISIADCCGREMNVRYPHEACIESVEQLRAAVAQDHVCGVFKDNRRSVANFLRANTVVMDCDNDHSDNPADWLKPEDLGELWQHVNYAIVPSRHDGVEKDGRAARPRFHVYFTVDEIWDAVRYRSVKIAIQKEYPLFDGNALDAARFVYGCEVDDSKIIWHEGGCNIDAVVSASREAGNVIPNGQRNSTLSLFAGRVLKRLGLTDKAHEAFLERAAQCETPLEDEELEKIWRSAVNFFNTKVITQPGYVPPDQYSEFYETSLEPNDYTDVGEADILEREYGNKLRYTDGTDFIRYNGSYWEEKRQAGISVQLELLNRQLQESRERKEAAFKALVDSGVNPIKLKQGGRTAERALETPDQEKLYFNVYMPACAYLKFILKQRDANRIKAVLIAVRSMVDIDIAKLDSDEFLLNTPSGTYDLRKGMAGFQEHSPWDFITKCTMVDPGDEGMEVWQNALQEFFCGDAALIRYAQCIAGLVAIGKVYQEGIIIAYGEGRNGKSTYWNSQGKVLGSYSGTISADALTTTCRRNVKPEMAEIKGKRMIIAAELEEGTRMSTSIVKQLCSTDPVSGEKKFKSPFHFDPTHTLILYTNHLPRVGATDEGTWRRLIVMPFNAVFSGKSDIKNYTDYLVKHAGPAILQWIIEGARMVVERGFELELPQVVKDAILEYRDENNWLKHFIDDCCDVGEQLEEQSGKLLSEYRAYCMQTGEHQRGQVDFYAALERMGFMRKRRSYGRFVVGLKLKAREFLT